jgi:TonB family protein
MKKSLSFVLSGILLVAALTVFAPAALLSKQDQRALGLNDGPQTGRKVALIIGNGAYANVKKLRNPPNDAADMAEALQDLGFELIGGGAGLNLSQRDMKQRIREFGGKLRGGGVGVFYYAGHGVQLNGRNYLLPVELAVESEADLEDAAVDLQFVFNNLRDANNGLNIVILDACRNNPFEGKTRDARDGLAEVRAATGTLIAYATAPGSVASDGEGRNGTYTAALLKQLKKPGLEVLDMFRQTREDVFAVSKQKQVPWTNESLIGRFCFNGCGTTAAQPATKPSPDVDDAAFELEYWNAIKDSSDPEEYRGYLQRFPNGRFREIAERRARGARGGNGTASRAPATPTPTPSVQVEDKIEPPKAPAGDVLNGKAVSLPKPSYPAIAAAARASGPVNVQVTIDEKGNVIDAKALDGHALLQAAAVAAARRAKFSPTLLEGKPVKVTGVIVYNFTAN